MRLAYHSASRCVPTILLTLLLAWGTPAAAQLTLEGTFNPSEDNSLCSIAVDSATGTVWVYECSSDTIGSYSSDGTFLSSIPRPGESANDVDLDIADVQVTLGAIVVPVGTVLFINGEGGTAEIYGIDPATGTVLASLETEFGVSHVVGGGYHATRDVFYLIQDSVPSAADENRVAEIDPISGEVVSTFQTTSDFSVFYGDLDVASQSDALFLVSSSESGIGEFTLAGDFVTSHALPAGVSNLSGIALNCAAGEAWVASTNGDVWRLGQVPCAKGTSTEQTAAPDLESMQVYPNPFTARSSVVLSLDRPQRVRVALYDILGREMLILHDGTAASGENRFALDGSQVPSGLYMLRAEGETFDASQRVVRID